MNTVTVEAPSQAVTSRKKPLLIRHVAVLGAGTMGSRIAAHLANAGVPVLLLDLASPEPDRNRIVAKALEALKSAKPAALFEPVAAGLISPGNFEDDLERLRDCDWIIEAVAENLEIKQTLLRNVEMFRRADAIVTTNTSGLPVSQIAAGLSQEFRRHWFGTHFFNPPRYMRLLEIIPTPDSDPDAIAAISEFARVRLGKSIVRAKDTPNFIANRIGTFALLNTIRVMQAMDLSIEQVDALTGSALGWPKTGTFRLSDLVGIDVLAHVAENFLACVKDERSDIALPDFLSEMLKRGWLGDKAGQGFYKKQADGSRLALDWKTLEYRPSQRAKFPLLEMAKNVDSPAERIRMALSGDPKKDVAAAFYWQVLPDLWSYSAHRIPEISDDIVSIDAAMKAGFNWDLGPFEMWDAAGVPETAHKMKAAAPAVEKLLASGHTSWYRDDRFFDIGTATYQPIPVIEKLSSIQALKRSRGVVKKNAGASLVDLGDGIACIELHSKMNAIGGDIVSLVTQTLRPESDALKNFDGFVISSDAANFSVGANLMQLLLAIQEQEWDEIDLAVRAFQGMTQAIKFCPRPVVAAPAGMCFGGGAEIALHAAARQPHAELYIGLVEVGVGLIPAGGGCKEMALRALEAANGQVNSVEFMNALKNQFEAIAMAKVSSSAAEARTLGFLSPADSVTMNRDRVLADAKEKARELADGGYAPPVLRTDMPAPGESILAGLRMAVHTMREGEYISDHDAKIGNRLAHVLCGGRLVQGTPVSEQYWLDLEREAFLSLCGEARTQERIASTLKTGKPLRN
jgi:3-hydroxyacyl-CoA dehydrogenase